MNIVGELEKEDPGHEYIYPSVLHCTVKTIGPKAIPEMISRINKALKDFKSFEVTLQGLNSFTTNTFIQVFSRDSKLFSLHNLLKDVIPFIAPQSEGENYVPHVAVIYYYHKPDKLFSALGRHKDTLIGKMKVDRINLIKGNPSLLIERMEVIKTFRLR